MELAVTGAERTLSSRLVRPCSLWRVPMASPTSNGPPRSIQRGSPPRSPPGWTSSVLAPSSAPAPQSAASRRPPRYGWPPRSASRRQRAAIVLVLLRAARPLTQRFGRVGTIVEIEYRRGHGTLGPLLAAWTRGTGGSTKGSSTTTEPTRTATAFAMSPCTSRCRVPATLTRSSRVSDNDPRSARHASAPEKPGSRSAPRYFTASKVATRASRSTGACASLDQVRVRCRCGG